MSDHKTEKEQTSEYPKALSSFRHGDTWFFADADNNILHNVNESTDAEGFVSEVMNRWQKFDFLREENEQLKDFTDQYKAKRAYEAKMQYSYKKGFVDGSNEANARIAQLEILLKGMVDNYQTPKSSTAANHWYVKAIKALSPDSVNEETK